jgi:hypothetical protein
MKKKKFRHIHRYAFVDIGNRPRIYKSVFNLLTDPAKLRVREKNGYVIDDTPGRCGYKTPLQILASLRRRACGVYKDKEILRKNPKRGITRIDQVQPFAIKRVPFWEH